MRLAATLLIVAAVLWHPPAARAEAQGILPPEVLDAFPRERLAVEINLQGAPLRLLAAATRSADPDFAATVSELRAIRVRIVDLEGEDAGPARSKVERAVRWLEGHGWFPAVRLREDDHQSHVFIKDEGDRIGGLVVVFLGAASAEEGSQAGLIEIDGAIDVAKLEKLLTQLDLPRPEGLDAEDPP